MSMSDFLEKKVYRCATKLTTAEYWLADSGRFWYLTSDSPLQNKYGLIKYKLETMVYYRKDNVDKLVSILAS